MNHDANLMPADRAALTLAGADTRHLQARERQATRPLTAIDRLCRSLDMAFGSPERCVSHIEPSHEAGFARAVRAALAEAIADDTLLGATHREGSPDCYRRHLLAADPLGRYAVAALVWMPGQMSPVHAHHTWCGYAVIEGALTETVFEWSEAGQCASEVRTHPREPDPVGLNRRSKTPVEELGKRGGARTWVLCETNGGGLPWDVQQVVATVLAELQHPLGIHAHDDSGCGVANSLAAVLGGARHVQGTINGFGERCGNANLSVIVPNLELKLGFRALEPGKLEEVTELSRFVADVANVTHDAHMAYVGRSAFAHKGGIHVAAMRRHADSYQHISPETVGNVMRVVVSELSGRGSVLSKAEELGVQIRDGADLETLNEIKAAEARGLSFESAEASVALLLLRRAKGYTPLFEILDYQAQVGQRQGSQTFAEGMVKVRVGSQVLHTVADGNGPVGALDTALRKALAPMYPSVEHIHLADYKVRILDGTEGTSAITRVLIDSRDEHGSWSTVGASPNIIEASMQALVDSIEYGLIKLGVTHATGPGSTRPTGTPSQDARSNN